MIYLLYSNYTAYYKMFGDGDLAKQGEGRKMQSQ